MAKALKFLFALTLLAIFIAPAAPAGAGIVMIDKSGAETLISGHMTKSPDMMDMGVISIFNARDGLLTYLNTNDSTYSTGTASEYCSATNTGAMSMQEDMLRDMPPEIRDQMRETMRLSGSDHMGPTPEVAVMPAGHGGIIAGYETTRYEILSDGQLMEEIWITDDPSLMGELSVFYTEGMKEFSCNEGPMRGLQDSPEYLDLMSSGIALRIIIAGDMMGPTYILDVQSIQRRDIPDSEFAPPPGYTEISPDEMMGLLMGGFGFPQ